MSWAIAVLQKDVNGSDFQALTNSNTSSGFDNDKFN